MRRKVFALGVMLATCVLGGSPARAVGPSGSWSCNAVGGNLFIPQQLHSAGVSPWKYKGQGWATDCDNSLNTGDPVIAAQYKFGGKHSGPNTCAAAAGPSYYGKIKVRWFYFNSSTGSIGFVNSMYGSSNTPFPYSTAACPGPFTATLPWVNGYAPAGPSVTLSGTQVSPSCGVAGTLCSNTFPNGLIGYTYGLPGVLSVP